jgi:predicted Rossmann fold flavoprotein
MPPSHPSSSESTLPPADRPPGRTDVVVIGGGAAGLMCAIEAGKRGRQVVLLEHANKVGKKILISGGGRCNFTNRDARAECYLCSNPHFPRSALARYTAADFIALVEKHRIAYHEKKLGQLFCDDSSRQIVQLLLDEAAEAGVDIRTGQAVEEVEKTDGGFRVQTGSTAFEASSVVVASGGLSIPKMGATDFGHRVARRFDLRLVEPRPGLVPLTWSQEDLTRFRDLSGISLDASISCGKVRFRENLLFTHRGLSGPAILQISSYWRRGQAITIDLLPDLSRADFVQEIRTGMKTGNWLSRHLPRRLVELWLDSRLADRPAEKLSRAEGEALEEALHRWTVQPAGTEGYAKAEVTLGGVDTNLLSSKTMEARNTPGLFFIGEAVDVTGWLGGYNFQWAWASGWVAGQFA